MKQQQDPSEPSIVPEIIDQTGPVDGDGAGVIELGGVIKWFDASKGYGFIIPDNGMADVFVEVRGLRRDGFQGAYEGMRVVAEAVRGPRGLHALRILSMEE